MRNISFMLTTQQFRDRSKFVTRRLGWKNVKRGDILMGVEKGQGLKKGEKIKRLGAIRVTHVAFERLMLMIADPPYGKKEAVLEGFPQMSGRDFVKMFCQHNHCEPSQIVTRIMFEYV